MRRINDIENKIGYMFKDKKLLEIALTHKSYANENKKISILENNERLEFLGDAVLEHLSSIYLYNIIPVMNEGIMTKKRAELVCEKTLSESIKELGISDFLKLGKCEVNTGGNKKNALLADMAEAILGAVYLDGGFEKANQVFLKLLGAYIETIINQEINTDFKTTLQEILQKKGNVKITYSLDKETGKDHNKTFYTSVYYEQKKLGEGIGKTKKESEQKAAQEAIQRLSENKNKSKK